MTMNDTDRRNALARLPKWAQREIGTLQMRLAEAKQHITELNGEPEDSSVAVLDYAFGNRKLGQDVTIQFTLPGRIRITVGHDGNRPGMLSVRNEDGGPLYVSPVSGNHLRISTQEH